MPPQLRVSFVVPLAGASGEIENCLSSLLSQTLSGVEIILVGAEDAPASALDAATAYAKRAENIRMLTHVRREGGSLRMAGLQAAAGSHVCFLDPDCWVTPSFAQELLLACRRHRVPVARSLCVSHPAPDGAPVPEAPASRIAGVRAIQRDAVLDSMETLLWTPITGACLFDRSFLLKHGITFPSAIRRFDDLAFHAQWVHHARRLAVVAAPLHHRRPSPPGDGAPVPLADLFSYFQAFRYLEGRLPGRFLDGPEYFLLKFQTHDYALSAIDGAHLAEYRTRTAFDLYFRLKARRAVHYIRALYKLKSKYGRRALKLYTYYLALKRDRPGPHSSNASCHRMQ